MRLEAMRTYSDDEVVDAVVVGTGAGGAPLLAQLARRGLRVVALEAGANGTPDDHTPDELSAVDINWMQERLSGGSTPTAFGPNNSGRGVGGSTLHWGAFTPRPDARDLQLRSSTGCGADWVVGHDELTSYLERVEADIGVSGPGHYPWDPQRRYLLPPAARNASAELMLRGCSALGLRATDAPAAVLTRDRQQPDHGLRQACVGCGACHQGCRNTAKASMDTTYLPSAVAHGAEIRPDSFVHGIEVDAAGRVVAVLYRRDGVERRQRCAQLVLAAGGVETPRLLLHTGLANRNGQVGRNFMAHGGTQVWGRFPEEVRSYRGYPSSAITEDYVRPDGVDFAGGYLIQSLGVMPLTYATTLTRGAGLWGRELVDELDAYRYRAGVGINAECLPHEDNRLELADGAADVDEHGVPLARVLFSEQANERAIRDHAVARMSSIVEAAGGTDLLVLERSAHTLGTCRMGTDPDTSVVDADGRSHEIDNLWISDNSTFASSLSANPALTGMALALRTADAMVG